LLEPASKPDASGTSAARRAGQDECRMDALMLGIACGRQSILKLRVCVILIGGKALRRQVRSSSERGHVSCSRMGFDRNSPERRPAAVCRGVEREDESFAIPHYCGITNPYPIAFIDFSSDGGSGS
jgi:hypothetical protein